MSNQVTELTPEQEAKMPEYVKKWTEIGLSTAPFTIETATEIIHDFQKLVLEVNETPVEIYDDPKLAWKAVCRHEGLPEDTEFVTPYQTGSFSASTFSFYDFFIRENLIQLDPQLLKKYKAWERTSELGLIYPLDNVCVVSQKPSKIATDSQGRLHCENGPAVEYPSGWKLFALNGVTVPEYLVMTDAEYLSMDFFKKETNADVKAEFVRKYGVERMLELGKKVDSYENYKGEEYDWWHKSQYELWDMAYLFPWTQYQPYLKMVNQTTGIFHVEACSPQCRTLGDAIKERFGGEDLKIVSIH